MPRCVLQGDRVLRVPGAVAWLGSSLSCRLLHTLLGRLGCRGLDVQGAPVLLGSATLWDLSGGGAYGPGRKPAFRSTEGLGCDFRFARPGQPQFCLLLAVNHQR